MVSKAALASLMVACVVAAATAQRSPYAGASDPGVLPQYLPEGDNRFGGNSEPQGTPPPKLHAGTLETEALYNRVQSWPDDKKPFWFLNSAAIQAQREKEQQQQAQRAAAAAQSRRAPFAGSRSTNSRSTNSRSTNSQ